MSNTEVTAAHACSSCTWLYERGRRTTPPPYHGPDTATYRYRVGDKVTVPAEKCPCCDNHHGIADWTGTITGTEHEFHARPADMEIPGPYYTVALADGVRTYGESELGAA